MPRKRMKPDYAQEEVQQEMNLSQASVQSYLPYKKIIYDLNELSPNAEQIETYRIRKRAREELQQSIGSGFEMDLLWSCIEVHQNYPFQTVKQLTFTYEVHGNALFFNRKKKSVTRSSVEVALKRVLEMGGVVNGPKQIGVFGASYLYPMFIKFGLIKAEDRCHPG